MGKSILLITFGVSLLLGFAILKLNTNTTQGVETAVNKFDKTHARLIANSAVEMQLEKLRRWETISNFSGNLFGGSYKGYITYNSDSSFIVIRAYSKFQKDAEHYVKVEAERRPFTPPQMQGALTITTEAFASKLNITGTQKISGFEHDSAGNKIDSLPPIPGITVDSSSQVYTLAENMSGNSIVEGASPLVQGYKGNYYSIAQATSSFDWVQKAWDYASMASVTIGSPGQKVVLTNFNEGTLMNPKIVRIEGDVSLPGGSTGSGVLVVNGNLTLNGGFKWLGLIIAYAGDSKIEIKFDGGATVIGGIVVQGKNVQLLAAGGKQGFELYHSSQVLKILQEKLKTPVFNILSWWE